MASSARPASFPYRQPLLAIAAGVLGFAANGFAFPIFGGTSLVFGGAFSLLIAFTMGPVCGALTAAIAFSRTWPEWQHPAALTCFTLEAFVAGWLIHRRGWRPLGAVAVYWLAIGFPLAAIWLNHSPEIPFPSQWAIALKYPVNGLLMALLALVVQETVLQQWPALATRTPRVSVSLQQMLFRRFGAIAALPVAMLSFLAGHQFDQARREDVTKDLSSGVNSIALLIQRHLDTHRQIISTLARELASGGDTAPASLHRQLESVRREYPGFLTLLVTDRHGTILATAHPAENPAAPPPPTAGLDVSDRPYFRVPVATGQPYLSNVFQGRGLGHDLIVAVSAPVIDESGTVQFVVEGSLNLGEIGEEIAHARIVMDADIVITDRNQRVVLARGSYAHLAPLTPFIHDTLYDAARTAGAKTFYHDGWSDNRKRVERYLAASTVMPGFGWRIYVQEPVWSVQRSIAEFYLTTLLWTATGVAIALILARITAKALTSPLAGLLRATRALSSSRPGPDIGVLDTSGVPVELAELSGDVHAAALRLRKSNLELELLIAERERSHRELLDVLQTLDAKVADRTAELQHARTAAESASLAKSEFLASMSHELRTPLNVILGMNELLTEQKLGALNPRQLDCLQSVDESGRHLLSLINDILDLSKIEAGRVQLDLQPVSIRDVCEASLRMIQEIARRKNIRVSAEYLQPSSGVTADPRRLKQILVNLLSNAAKFTPEGGCVGLTVTQTVAPASLQLAVWDTGIGISPDDLAKLFQPFVQIDSALSRRYNGTGLGLALVKRMVQLHGGTVTVESTVNLGSRFTLTLPLTAEEAANDQPSGSPAPNPIDAEARSLIPGSPLLLLAEDNPANVALIQHFAQMRGCRIVLASTGVEAVAHARETHPDIILMDVNMPEMDGLEATRRISSDPRTRRIPIICLTANAMAEDRSRCLAAGASAYLSKPVNLRELAATITRLLPAARSPAPVYNI